MFGQTDYVHQGTFLRADIAAVLRGVYSANASLVACTDDAAVALYAAGYNAAIKALALALFIEPREVMRNG